MKARQFVAIVALHAEPVGAHVTRPEREEALNDALRGVVLGSYDELICARLVYTLDVSTIRVIVSLMERVRAAGMVEVLDAENALRARHPHPQPTHRHRGVAEAPQYGISGGYLSGSGGPGL